MIPTNPADCASAEYPTVGGVPAVFCPQETAGPYTVQVKYGWNVLDTVETFDPELLPVLVIGALLAEIDPALPGGGTMAAELGLALVIGPPPPSADVSLADVPADFQIVQPLNVQDEFVGVLLPLASVNEIVGEENAFWLRMRTVDEAGGESMFYAYFEAGLPTDAEGPVGFAFQLLTGGGSYEANVGAAPAPDEAGPLGEIGAGNVQPVYPAPVPAVAVRPACGFPVQVTEPVQVSGIGGGPVPVTSETTPQQVGVFVGTRGAGAAVLDDLDLTGVSQATLRREDDGASGSLYLESDSEPTQTYALAGGEVLQIAAPAGSTFGADGEIFKLYAVGPTVRYSYVLVMGPS